MLNLIKWSVLIVELCAFLVALFTFRRHTLIFRIFFFDLLLVFLTEATSLTARYAFGIKNTLWTNDVYMLAEVWLMGLAGYFLIHNTVVKKLLPWVLAAFTVMMAVNIWLYGVREPSVMCLLSGNMIQAFIFLFVMIQLVNTSAISREPLFWMCIGLIIYYGCSIPYWGVFNYLVKNNLPLIRKLVVMLWIIDILRYGLTIVSFLLLPKKTKTELSPA